MATADEFAAVRPRLFHMAEPEAWPSIQAHGLLSTTAALDLYGVSGEARTAVERTRRLDTVWLEHPVHGRFPVRDQRPLNEAALARSLTGGLAPADWYAILNGRAFLWADPARLERMRRTYRRRPNLVLTVDTGALVAAYGDRVEVSLINSGVAFPMSPAPRGRETFRPLAGLTAAELRRVAEVTVPDGVPDFVRYVTSVELVAAEP